MSNNLEKRYGEPKLVGDIIKEMWFGQEDLQKKMLKCLSDKSLIENTMKISKECADVINRFDKEYQISSQIIIDIDELFERTKHICDSHKKSVIENTITSNEIYAHAQSVQEQLNELENRRSELCKTLRKMINKMPLPEYEKHYNKEVNDFCLYFRNVYNEIDDLIFNDQQLVKKIWRY